MPGKELAENKRLFRSQLSRVRQRARVLEEQVRRFYSKRGEFSPILGSFWLKNWRLFDQVLALTEEKRRGWSSGSPSPSARSSPAAVRAAPVSPVSPRRCASSLRQRFVSRLQQPVGHVQTGRAVLTPMTEDHSRSRRSCTSRISNLLSALRRSGGTTDRPVRDCRYAGSVSKCPIPTRPR